MSADFSPRICWFVNEQNNDLYLQNIKYTYNGKSVWAYTEEELNDRKAHKALAVLGTDIYKKIRNMLSEDDFNALNNQLQAMIDADVAGKSTASFPEEMTCWYYNRNNHHYHEPNDEEFLEYVTTKYNVKRKD